MPDSTWVLAADPGFDRCNTGRDVMAGARTESGDPAVLTERQRKWFASVRASLHQATGKSLEEWVAIAVTCPEAAPRKRLAWLKAKHGLGQNYASLVLSQAFPPVTSWRTPDALEEALWKKPEDRAVLEAVKALALALPDTLLGQRKGFTAFSRKFQFAAVRPYRSGVLLGLAVEPSVHPALAPATPREGLNERLKSVLLLDAPGDVEGCVGPLLQAAWERS